MGGNGWWAGWVLMDGGTARPDLKRRVTRAAPLARQERVLPTDGNCCLWVWSSCVSLLVLSVPWDYVPSSWSFDNGCCRTNMSCGILKYWTRARSRWRIYLLLLDKIWCQPLVHGRVPARGDYNRPHA